MYLLREGPIDTFHIFKALTISNKLMSKVSAQKKGEKSYDSYKYVFKFRCFAVDIDVAMHSFCLLTLMEVVINYTTLKLIVFDMNSLKRFFLKKRNFGINIIGIKTHRGWFVIGCVVMASTVVMLH